MGLSRRKEKTEKTERTGNTAKKMRKGVQHILSIFLMLGMTVILLGISIWTGPLSERIVRSALQESEYYTQAYEEFTDSITGTQEDSSEISDEILDQLTYTKYYVAAQSYVAKALQGSDASLGELQLTSSILGEDETGQYSDVICEIYENTIRIPFIEQLGSLKQKWSHELLLGMTIAGACVLICVVCLFRQYSVKHRAVRQIGYSLFAASVLSGLITVMLGQKFTVQQVELLRYEQFLSNFISKCKEQCFLISFLGLLLSIGCFIAVKFLRSWWLGEN